MVEEKTISWVSNFQMVTKNQLLRDIACLLWFQGNMKLKGLLICLEGRS